MNWKVLLNDISQVIHGQNGHIFYKKEEINDKWLGFPPATEDEILAKEEELKIQLPNSYRSFLKTSNGFRQVSLFNGDLYPVQKIGWVADRDPDLIEILEDVGLDDDYSDEEYYVYGEDQLNHIYKLDHLKASLMISWWTSSAFILLNPKVRYGNEWEAWIYANWYPGAKRFRSFEELILREHELTLELLANKRSK